MAQLEEFRTGEKVEAAEDLPGIPAGTRGKIRSVTGLTWIRYRVQFDNGIERNLLDGARLRRPVPT